jgi:glutaminase
MPDYDDRTPLHLAAAEGHERIVGFLLRHGIPVDPRDRWGDTPLDEARRHGHDAVARLLAARGEAESVKCRRPAERRKAA